jgi:hypothetical protein
MYDVGVYVEPPHLWRRPVPVGFSCIQPNPPPQNPNPAPSARTIQIVVKCSNHLRQRMKDEGLCISTAYL